MISIDDFKQIRTTRHLIVLDTNILLELYRQPAYSGSVVKTKI